MIVVDTDILIDFGRGDEVAKDFLKTLEEKHKLAISAVTHMELIVGCQNKAALRKLDQFLKRFQLLHIEHVVSTKAIELLSEYRLSHGLLMPDSLIAATAICAQIPLASKNQKDYRFIAELTLLPYP